MKQGTSELCSRRDQRQLFGGRVALGGQPRQEGRAIVDADAVVDADAIADADLLVDPYALNYALEVAAAGDFELHGGQRAGRALTCTVVFLSRRALRFVVVEPPI